jgi:hypothetical protein
LGTELPSDPSSEERLDEVPAPVSPAMAEAPAPRLENDEVWMG